MKIRVSHSYTVALHIPLKPCTTPCLVNTLGFRARYANVVDFLDNSLERLEGSV